jgi:transcriptional antiterminator RfaH
MRHWYAVYTKPRQEALAEEHLGRQGFHVWFPRALRSRRRRGRWRDLAEALFPRYLFIQLDLQRDNAAPIRSTLGVSGMVRRGDWPAVVPDAVIDGLQAAADPETGLHRLTPRPLVRGDRVAVLEGPFQGLEGIFRAASGTERVTILLDILGGSSRVSLSRHCVARVAAGDRGRPWS